MPRPTPISSRGNVSAVALVLGEVNRAKPAPTPSMPADTKRGEAPAPKAERARSERSITRRPATMGGRVPVRSENRPAAGERRAMITAPGARASPTAAAPSPFTSESISGTRTRLVRLASIPKKPTAAHARYARFLKSAGETKGSGVVFMRHAKRRAKRTAATKEPHEIAAEKPATCPSVTPNRESPAARASRAPPGKSKEADGISETVSG